jgi:N-acetylgalactosamine-6-sulfatase
MNPIALVITCFLLVVCSISAEPAAQPPNIVFLLADDLGGSDLHCYGNPYSRTPNIDSLARDGTRFIHYYATGATCCPTRTGLMTSQYPATFRVYPANGGFADRITVTELLKKRGYATGHFGKWHIGPETKNGTYGIDLIGTGEEGGGKKKNQADERGRDAHIYDDAIKLSRTTNKVPFL